MTVVADANILAALVIPTDYSVAAEDLVAGWINEGIEIHSPALWSYEAASAVRKHARAHDLGVEDATALIGALTALPILEAAPDPDLLFAATVWAAKLDHSVIYDASYLALADRLGAPLWTADRRLARGARQAGASNVECLIDP